MGGEGAWPDAQGTKEGLAWRHPHCESNGFTGAQMTAKAPKLTPRAKKAELRHPVPQGLGEAGTALWTRKVADLEAPWRFDERELALLTEAGRTADDIAALDESIAAEGRMVEGSRGQPVLHGGVTEVRQLRALQLRLLSALTLTDPQDDAASGTPAQERGRRAANVRHSKTRRRSVKNG